MTVVKITWDCDRCDKQGVLSLPTGDAVPYGPSGWFLIETTEEKVTKVRSTGRLVCTPKCLSELMLAIADAPQILSARVTRLGLRSVE